MIAWLWGVLVSNSGTHHFRFLSNALTAARMCTQPDLDLSTGTVLWKQEHTSGGACLGQMSRHHSRIHPLRATRAQQHQRERILQCTVFTPIDSLMIQAHIRRPARAWRDYDSPHPQSSSVSTCLRPTQLQLVTSPRCTLEVQKRRLEVQKQRLKFRFRHGHHHLSPIKNSFQKSINLYK